MVQTETETITYVVQPGGACEIQRTFLERWIDSMPPQFFSDFITRKELLEGQIQTETDDYYQNKSL